MSAAAVRRAMCAPPISNGWSPKVFEILILTFVPPALVCTMRRRLWFLKRWRLPGMNGCGAVAHVPIHRLPWASTACEGLIAGFFGSILRHCWHGQQSDEGAGHGVCNQSVHGAGSAEMSCWHEHI